jgi:hypothetical protein
MNGPSGPHAGATSLPSGDVGFAPVSVTTGAWGVSPRLSGAGAHSRELLPAFNEESAEV